MLAGLLIEYMHKNNLNGGKTGPDTYPIKKIISSIHQC